MTHFLLLLEAHLPVETIPYILYNSHIKRSSLIHIAII